MALFDHSALFTLVAISVPWEGSALKWLYRLGNAPRELPAGSGDVQRTFSERLTIALVSELAREVRAHGADLIVSGFPSSRFPIQEVVSADREVEVIDLEDLRNAPREQMNWRHDSHLNPNGHRMVAEILLPRLEERLRGLIAGRAAHQGG